MSSFHACISNEWNMCTHPYREYGNNDWFDILGVICVFIITQKKTLNGLTQEVPTSTCLHRLRLFWIVFYEPKHPQIYSLNGSSSGYTWGYTNRFTCQGESRLFSLWILHVTIMKMQMYTRSSVTMDVTLTIFYFPDDRRDVAAVVIGYKLYTEDRKLPPCSVCWSTAE